MSCTVERWPRRCTGALRIDRDAHPRSLSSKLYTVNSRKEWHSPPCQAWLTLYELERRSVRVKGRTKTAPTGRPHAAKSPETHSRAVYRGMRRRIAVCTRALRHRDGAATRSRRSDGGCSDTTLCAGTDGSVDDFAFPPRLAH
jgi:hypothetical protein